jgi:hypothetical protein
MNLITTTHTLSPPNNADPPITLLHNTLTGTKTILVDGVVVFTSKRAWIEGANRVDFTSPYSRITYTVFVVPSFFSFTYRMEQAQAGAVEASVNPLNQPLLSE